MKVLYLTYDGLTDPLGQSQILPYIIGLSKKGHSFTIVSFEKEKRFEKNRFAISNICEQHQISWKPLPYTKNPPVAGTVFDIWQLGRISAKLHINHNFDIVHCRSYITALIGLKLKRKFNLKFIFDMRGFWADERVDGKLWNLKNPLYRRIYGYFKKKERSFLLESDAIISLTQTGKEEMTQWKDMNLSSKKITIIPCVSDFELFTLQSPESKKKSREYLKIPSESFVLSYLGSLGTWYMLEEMIHFFSILKSRIPNSLFLFLTPDSPDNIHTSAKKYGLDTGNFIIKFAGREEIPFLMHASDHSIFFIQPKYSKLSSSPTKMAELMAMGIPIICNSKIGDVEEIIRSNNAGICISQFSEQVYFNVVRKLQSGPQTDAAEIRLSAEKEFNLSTGIDRYDTVYTNL